MSDINAGQIWQDKRDERRVIKVLAVRDGVVEYLRRYETGKKRQTTGLALVRSFRGDYKCKSKHARCTKPSSMIRVAEAEPLVTVRTLSAARRAQQSRKPRKVGLTSDRLLRFDVRKCRSVCFSAGKRKARFRPG